ncbi:hypothetical protein, partial [Escherichia fergusonii]|uniref:hypothetical protein n=1 Tax=Escherichia fergusonii TaxID=564 RepID=UPI001CBDA372
ALRPGEPNLGVSRGEIGRCGGKRQRSLCPRTHRRPGATHSIEPGGIQRAKARLADQLGEIALRDLERSLG